MSDLRIFVELTQKRNRQMSSKPNPNPTVMHSSGYDDPSRADMLEFLTTAAHEDYEFDIEEAIYWYAHDYHGGQFTNLYEALCNSPFKPGAYSTGLPDGAALDMYMMLQQKFGGA